MTKVYLECNPFLEKIKCEINGHDATKDNAFLKCLGDPNKTFLQDWIGDFFSSLYESENDDKYEVEFFGLPSDYKDLFDAKKEFCQKNKNININLIQKDINVKSSGERIKDLKKLFKYMQENSPYDELKTDKIKKEFENALGDEEEIGIIATMSSGKSTLLNAILHEDLLPARNEATTAIVAKIYNDKTKHEFRVSAKDKDDNFICDDKIATPEILENLNSDKNVSDLKIFGNIPNINEYGLKVVLSDTPGPNNSTDKTHKAHTYELINRAYKPMILYVLNATQLQVNDDQMLLKEIASKIKESGIQSKDRFIFVLNKVDALDPKKDGNAKKAIENLKEYLKRNGIEEPKIFPVSAFLSRLIRLKQNGKTNLSDDDQDFLDIKPKRFIEQEERHLHKFSPLSQEGFKKLEVLEKEVLEKGDKLAFADICSGVPALEIAINEYVEKYAIRQKIKLCVQSFKGFMQTKKIKVNSMKEISKNEKNIENTTKTLEAIKKDIQNGHKAEAMQDRINKFDFNKDINVYLDKRSAELSKLISNLSSNENEMNIKDARKFMKNVKDELEHFRMQFLGEIQDKINEGLLKDIKAMFDEYQNYVSSLVSDNSSFDENFGGKISIGSLISTDFNENAIIFEFKEVISENYLISTSGNKNKAWYKPWTWLDDEYEEHWGTRTKDVFNAEKFCDEFLAKIQINFDKEIDGIKGEASDKVEKFKNYFGKKIKKMDKIILNKVEENEKLLKNKEEFKRNMESENEKIKWIESFEAKLNKVLEI